MKAKVGGRKIVQGKIERTCDRCGRVGTDIIRVRHHTTTGKGSFKWFCANGCQASN